MKALDSSDGILLIIIVILLAFSAFFSASETALSTANKLRLRKRVDETGDKQAKTVLSLTDNYDKTLSGILVGNNLVNIAVSSIMTVLCTALFGAKGAVVATGVATVLVLTFGEIMPKTYAGEHSEPTALRVARPLQTVITILSPISFLFGCLKRLLYTPAEKGPTVTEEELIYMIGSIGEEGVLEEQESNLVQSALEFDEISAHEILTPRVNVVALDVESSIEEIKSTVVAEGYARIPVYEGNIDNIIGILYSREFLNRYISGGQIVLRDMLGEPLFVPKRMKLAQLLTQLKSHKVNVAVVTDDYGGTLGIVTMEDVLEELVGDIWDEDDEIPVGLVRLDEHTVEVVGDYSLEQMFEALGVDGDEAQSDYNTAGGWAMGLFEHIPEVQELIEYGRFALAVLEMNGHRIARLRVSVRQAQPDETDPV